MSSIPEQEHTCEEVNGIRAAMDQRVTSMAEGVTLDYRDGGVICSLGSIPPIEEKVLHHF
ncbi:hypothetical protein HNR44_001661 [Geomicrobium halophilum]|uniref:Uncharacterized protein n=1 Tax=Geomicrobium halophilum TaxID=549000 RepID=A0A841PYF6_9BACL|nr:hypothetical protein [Geomicrobium halophilum]MBB6449683.1 hypothetical protein [Geomicrobium halophilum]